METALIPGWRTKAFLDESSADKGYYLNISSQDKGSHVQMLSWTLAPLHGMSVGLFLLTFLLYSFLGWGGSSVGKASDWHATNAGSIPQLGKGFFSYGQL